MRPVLNSARLALSRVPLESSRQATVLDRISIPAMSRRTVPACGAGLGAGLDRGGGAAASPGAFNRSSKLVFPSLCLARSAVSPESVTRSTTTFLENSGRSASDILASSMRAKILLLSGSDRDVFPTATPTLGKTVNLRLPSIASVRPVLSFTAAVISGLYLLGSKMATTTARASRTSATTPPTASNTYLRTFMRTPYSLATPNGTCPVATCRLADSQWPRWSSKKMSAPKEGFVDADIPGAQRAHHALVRGRAARGHQGGPDRRAVGRVFRLDAVQRREETLERPAGQRLLGGSDFARGEGLEALALVDALRLVGEQHRVAVERDAQLLGRLDVLPDVGRQDGRGGVPHVEGLAHVDGIRRKKQVRIEGRHVGISVLPAGERRAGDIELVMLDRVHNAHSRVGSVA